MVVRGWIGAREAGLSSQGEAVAMMQELSNKRNPAQYWKQGRMGENEIEVEGRAG